MARITLRTRIVELSRRYGGLSAAAVAVRVDPGYMVRLRDGDKTNPSSITLRKLGLKSHGTTRYERIPGHS
jgi:hypothetical protein